jgi:hypothetical protein
VESDGEKYFPLTCIFFIVQSAKKCKEILFKRKLYAKTSMALIEKKRLIQRN